MTELHLTVILVTTRKTLNTCGCCRYCINTIIMFVNDNQAGSRSPILPRSALTVLCTDF